MLSFLHMTRSSIICLAFTGTGDTCLAGDHLNHLMSRRHLATLASSAAPRIQAAVIGAGVVGLATARELAARGVETVVLESEDSIATGISSRNSEVIHAGIYYQKGSLKAQTCVSGRRRLYEFCDAYGVAYKRCGKLLVATSDEQLPLLDRIAAQSRENGVVHEDEALRRVTRGEAEAIEPNVRCVGALLSPSTGVVDSHGLSLALLGCAQSHGAELAVRTSVLGGQVQRDRGTVLLQTTQGDLECEMVVNAAGHGTEGIARAIDGMPTELVPTTFHAKGNYFALRDQPSPFRGLVYPLPQEAGLGVHATVDMDGRCRFGPDVEWTRPQPDGRLDYTVDPARADAFYAEVRKYWPALPPDALVPDYAGIRPKLQGPGGAAQDFLVQGPTEHGVAGLVHLFGIESPGLTASLALARVVVCGSLGLGLDSHGGARM
jgi:L-2-hydroxyglutarate oxidase LhgO